MKDIILIGGGGHCKSVIDVIEQEGRFKIAGIVDKPDLLGSNVLGYPVIGDDSDLASLANKYQHALIAVGQIKSPSLRIKLFNSAIEAGFILPSIISPRAYVSKHAMIGEGTVVMHDALINANAKVGENCIINSKALIEHDAIIENHCHISTGAIINGSSVVENNTSFGSNSLVKESTVVKSDSVIKGGHGRLKIGYFADGQWSHKAFERLISDKDIIIQFICVRFDTQDDTLKKFCQKYNIDYLKDENINSKVFIDNISKHKCDLFVSMSFNQIFKNEIINLTKYKIINCHAGKLPFYRGRNILNWALINNEDEFGITVHYVDKGIDTGDIILQKSYSITMQDNYATLLEKAYVECASILYEAVCLFKGGDVAGKKQIQIHPTGFYCSQRKFGDEVLDWSQSSEDIFNFVRAICFPGPKARAFINGKEVKINKVELVGSAVSYQCITGAILNISKDSFLVKTGDSFVKIIEYKTEAKLKVGDRFEIK